MIKRGTIEQIVNRIKADAVTSLDNKEYERSLRLISVAALTLYNSNFYYMDEDLEIMLNIIAHKLPLCTFHKTEEKKVLFYDGFGFDDRGLAQIYIKSLCQSSNVVYVTFDDKKASIPNIKGLLENHSCHVYYIKRNHTAIIDQIIQLDRIMDAERPSDLFFYSNPNDVVCTVIMNKHEDVVRRYLINLTDHAFWLGSKCIDTCIEFRGYGASITEEYRKISRDKISVLPYYPIIHTKREFQGFPFKKKPEQKVMFSGGSLYKTFGGGDRYYAMVDYFLYKYNYLVFWYAGSGDESKLRRIMKKYPGRVYLTPERMDLYQVLCCCDLYLNTYPLCGGLMYQYAASAGKVPLTLVFDNANDGFLIDQKKLNVDFNNQNQLYEEADRLLTDDVYRTERGIKMRASVINEELFSRNLSAIINGKETCFNYSFNHVDTVDFRTIYLKRQSLIDVFEPNVDRMSVQLLIKMFPIVTAACVLKKIRKKVSNILFGQYR